MTREDLEREGEALIAEIASAFAGVTRESGVSWGEAWCEGLAIPEKPDADRSWQDVADNAKWSIDTGNGGFAFLDAIGFRYYLPAAMVRSLRAGMDLGLQYPLSINKGRIREHHLQQWSLLTEAQIVCVRRYVAFMASLAFEQNDDLEHDTWVRIGEDYWNTAIAPERKP